MAAYFLDSSAAVKLYVAEPGTPWLLRLAAPMRGHLFLIARITVAEVAAAIHRRVRGHTLTLAQAQRAVIELRRDLARTYRPVEVSSILIDLALDIAERHGLRGYDCVQLAAALTAQRRRQAAGASPLTLLTPDMELAVASQAEGLQVDDPNNHP